MKRKRTYPYRPDYAVSPGEVIEEHLESLGMSQAEFAKVSGLPLELITRIVAGMAPITPEIANILEQVLGRPAELWLKLEQNFRKDIARLAAEMLGSPTDKIP